MADTGEQAGRESSASQQPPEPPPDDQVPPIVVPAVPAIDMNVPGLTMHMYQPIPDSAPSANGSEEAPRKRRQVKVACTNCQKACKRCDDSRPCSRCIHYGIVDTCVDSGRKERRKGLKRGPYKKRDGKGTGSDRSSGRSGSLPSTHAMTPPPGHMQLQAVGPHMLAAPYMGPMGYPPPAFFQYAPNMPSIGRPGEPAPVFFPPYYVPVPSQPPPGHEHHHPHHPPYQHPPASFMPAQFFNPYHQPYGSFMMPGPPRPDGSMPMPMQMSMPSPGQQYLPPYIPIPPWARSPTADSQDPSAPAAGPSGTNHNDDNDEIQER